MAFRFQVGDLKQVRLILYTFEISRSLSKGIRPPAFIHKLLLEAEGKPTSMEMIKEAHRFLGKGRAGFTYMETIHTPDSIRKSILESISRIHANKTPRMPKDPLSIRVTKMVQLASNAWNGETGKPLTGKEELRRMMEEFLRNSKENNPQTRLLVYQINRLLRGVPPKGPREKMLKEILEGMDRRELEKTMQERREQSRKGITEQYDKLSKLQKMIKPEPEKPFQRRRPPRPPPRHR